MFERISKSVQNAAALPNEFYSKGHQIMTPVARHALDYTNIAGKKIRNVGQEVVHFTSEKTKNLPQFMPDWWKQTKSGTSKVSSFGLGIVNSAHEQIKRAMFWRKANN